MQKYRGMDSHDLLITLAVTVDQIKEELVGNGKKGLCTRMDEAETVLTRFGVYFAIMGAAVGIGVPLLIYLNEHWR